MGQLHQLIKRQGIEAARKEALDKLDRQCVDAAVAVMFDEQQRVGIMMMQLLDEAVTIKTPINECRRPAANW